MFVTKLKRTPLFDVYHEYGGKTIDFGGWELPVQFSGIQKEHEAVRTKAGLFDVSHMGEVIVEGKDSLRYLQKMVTNNVENLKTGYAQYTAMCYENGGTVDDLLIYQLAENKYLLVVNAANIEKDYAWLKEHQDGKVAIHNISDSIAQLAIQGPFAETVLQKLIEDLDLSTMKSFTFAQHVDVNGITTLVSRTGYTGEDGFELYCKQENAVQLWKALLQAGENEGIQPCGLGARDTLRFEAALCLYGQELSADISPLEAKIGFAVKLNKDVNFIGKEALQKQKEQGVPRKLVGVEMIERGIPRHGYKVWAGNEYIGEVTTGTHSPTLKKNIGLALLKTPFTERDQEVEIEIRSKRVKAKVILTPFYKR
ncbi:glycine cleavage system aminomethyltransferase GcvT [Heyndrickxia ginsengihumi]|uniref:glycine cleavage system aminomethyltransferase GcvT n=1 Tax=Heyndrickxia ginsengihumi TaxID=363870 RepID=UPI003D1BE07F